MIGSSRLKRLFAPVLAALPFKISRWLPNVTLEPLDLVLANYCLREERITILQVGACDGITNDPIRHVVTKTFTRAILIEPNPLAYVRLEKAYAGFPNVRCIQVAVGEKDGEVYLYRVKRSLSSGASGDLTLQIASFYREHLEKHGKKPGQIEQITVASRTLPSLVAELGLEKIHLLQIDSEGFDAAVVRMALRMPVRPECINFEHIHLRKTDRRPLFKLLTENGYLLCYDEWNILALQKSFIEAPRTETASDKSNVLSC